ncbi:MAG TPA: hypothetical protein PLG50_10800, partial [bacterium]|nr:hypothetical protein [bacterium]
MTGRTVPTIPLSAARWWCWTLALLISGWLGCSALFVPAVLAQSRLWSASEHRAPASERGEAAVQDQIANSRHNAITRAVAEVSPAVVGINVVQV